MIVLTPLLKYIAVLGVAGSLVIPAQELAQHLSGDGGIAALPLPPRSAPERAAAPLDTSAVIALAPFGVPDKAEVPPPSEAHSRLVLILHGVSIAADPRDSSAFVSADGRTRRFGIGDTIGGGAVLTGIARDSIEIEVDDGRQRLFFPRGEDADRETAKSAPPSSPLPTAPPTGKATVPVRSGIDRLRAATSNAGNPFDAD